MTSKTKRITFLGIMLALCAVFSFIPIPGFPTTSFDSLPGFLTAIYINPLLGGIIALIGHLLTAYIHGIPLGIPGHFIIALSMFVSAFAFGKLFQKDNLILSCLAVIVAVLFNIYLSMPFLNWFLQISWSFLLSLQVPLLFASLINVLLAIAVHRVISKAKLR